MTDLRWWRGQAPPVNRVLVDTGFLVALGIARDPRFDPHVGMRPGELAQHLRQDHFAKIFLHAQPHAAGKLAALHCARGLVVQAFALRAAGGSCRFAWGGWHGHAVHQGLQTGQRVGLVLFQAAAALRLDDDHAFGGDALVTVRQQALFDRVGQRRGVHRKTQVHRVGHLVHVLPARALGADGGELDFGGIDAQHGAWQCATHRFQ